MIRSLSDLTIDTWIVSMIRSLNGWCTGTNAFRAKIIAIKIQNPYSVLAKWSANAFKSLEWCFCKAADTFSFFDSSQLWQRLKEISVVLLKSLSKMYLAWGTKFAKTLLVKLIYDGI